MTNTDAPLISGWERVAKAVEEVRERLRRATDVLNRAGIPYAVVGGNAVAEWVGRADPAAVRTTKDVNILLRRADLPAATAAMEAAGFVYRHVKSIDMFLDGPDTKARDAVPVVFAGEKVKADSLVEAPDVTESVPAAGFRVVSLEPLVRMKLTAYRDKDRTHLRDLLDVELIDATWLARLPPELAARLQALIDDPDG